MHLSNTYAIHVVDGTIAKSAARLVNDGLVLITTVRHDCIWANHGFCVGIAAFLEREIASLGKSCPTSVGVSARTTAHVCRTRNSVDMQVRTKGPCSYGMAPE